MEISQLIDFIPNELYIIGAVLYALGVILKQLSFVKDEYILLILLVASVGFAISQVGFCAEAVMYGVILTLAPVYANNLIKQTKKLVDQKKV